jgi:hypothetical protein
VLFGILLILGGGNMEKAERQAINHFHWIKKKMMGESNSYSNGKIIERSDKDGR